MTLARLHHSHSLHCVPTIVCTHFATLSGILTCWGFTLLYRLICLTRSGGEGSQCVFSLCFYFLFFFPFWLFPSFSPSPSFPSCHPSLATAKYLPPFYIVTSVSILPHRDSPRLLCLIVIYLKSCVVIYKLYIWLIWSIAVPKLCRPDWSHWHPSLFLFSITAKEQYVIPGEWLVNLHPYHCRSLFSNFPPAAIYQHHFSIAYYSFKQSSPQIKGKKIQFITAQALLLYICNHF